MKVGQFVSIAILVLVGASPASAESFTGTTTFVFVTENTVLELPSGNALVSIVQRGFSLAEDSSHPFHMANQDCYGSIVGTPESSSGAGYCRIVKADRSGVLWASWTASGEIEGGTWEILHGRGSFEGAKGSGTFTPPGEPWADGKNSNTATGTIELP